MKSSVKDARLYLILDTQLHDYDRLFEILKESVRCGVDIVQLRDKAGVTRDALGFLQCVLKYLNGRIPLIVNDRVDWAIAAGADGVHLGQEDVPMEAAREMLGKKKIIGVSCQSMEHARKAERSGADYIGFGSVFKTLTKPDRCAMNLELLSQVVEKIKIPVFTIGGIDLSNIKRIQGLGVKRVALTRAICLADHVGQAAGEFKRILGKTQFSRG